LIQILGKYQRILL